MDKLNEARTALTRSAGMMKAPVDLMALAAIVTQLRLGASAMLSHLEAQADRPAAEVVMHYRTSYTAEATACGLTKDDSLHHATVSPTGVTCPVCLVAMEPALPETAPACEHWWVIDRVQVVDADLERGWGCVMQCSKCSEARYAGFQLLSSTAQKG